METACVCVTCCDWIPPTQLAQLNRLRLMHRLIIFKWQRLLCFLRRSYNLEWGFSQGVTKLTHRTDPDLVWEQKTIRVRLWPRSDIPSNYLGLFWQIICHESPSRTDCPVMRARNDERKFQLSLAFLICDSSSMFPLFFRKSLTRLSLVNQTNTSTETRHCIILQLRSTTERSKKTAHGVNPIIFPTSLRLVSC